MVTFFITSFSVYKSQTLELTAGKQIDGSLLDAMYRLYLKAKSE